MANRRDVLTSTLAFSIAAAFQLTKATAQTWPSTYLKLLVGGAAGSVPDSLARLAADALSKKLGQAIIVENRAGAGGIIAMQGVAGSPPDGYTIGLATISQLVFSSYLFSKLPYDPTRDLKPISTLAWSSSVLVAHPSLSASTLPEVVALSQKEPGKLLLGIPANGSPPHIAALLLIRETGLSVTMVPFKTGPDALTAAMRGDVQLLIDGPTLLASQVDAKPSRPSSSQVPSASIRSRTYRRSRRPDFQKRRCNPGRASSLQPAHRTRSLSGSAQKVGHFWATMNTSRSSSK